MSKEKKNKCRVREISGGRNLPTILTEYNSAINEKGQLVGELKQTIIAPLTVESIVDWIRNQTDTKALDKIRVEAYRKWSEIVGRNNMR